MPHTLPESRTMQTIIVETSVNLNMSIYLVLINGSKDFNEI